MIRRIIPLLASCLLSLQTASATEVRAVWLGIAGLAITDGKTTLLFDPTFTRPNLGHWFFNTVFRANPERVRLGLEAASIQQARAVFVSHTHFDHAVDIEAVSRLTQATVFGGPSVKALVSGKPPHVPFLSIEDGKPLQIGDFTVIPHRRAHAAILHSGWHFLPGPMISRASHTFYDFREGETWFYRVEHPAVRIIVDQGSQLPENSRTYSGKTETYFVGVANRKSLEDLVHNNILKIRPALAVPIHFDFFLLQSDYLETLTLPGIGLKEISDAVSKEAVNFQIPTRYQSFTLPRKKNHP